MLLIETGFSMHAQNLQDETKTSGQSTNFLKLFLCGDVMTGRGIDQALPFPVQPVLFESWVKDAHEYLHIAEQKNGKIQKPVSWEYIWGDALNVWDDNKPLLKIINLETSITTFPEPWPGKGINYRMNPKNINILKTARIDYCSLANNHTMDWGSEGLIQTMHTLQGANIRFSGAGMNEQKAVKPSVFKFNHGRILIFSYAALNSGVPESWQAKHDFPGVNVLIGFNEKEGLKIKQQVKQEKIDGDIVIFSVHWGGNWGYSIPAEHRKFAHKLIDEAGVDVIFGHSSHHPMGIEVYKNKLIIYGAGDFINDYEGISGHKEYRGYLSLMYFPELEFETGNLKSLKMVPMEIKNFKLNHSSSEDALWLQTILNRECQKFGAGVGIETDNSLWMEWQK